MVDLYTGPWRKGDHGLAIIALKRIVSRANPDNFEWRVFDDSFNERLRLAVSALQAAHGIVPATGYVGEPTFRMLMKLPRKGYPRELAVDSVAMNLLEEAWGKLHPPITPIQQVRDTIASYCQQMEAYNQIWHYRQARPMTTLGVLPSRGGYSDCSEFATDAYWWARKMTGVFVPDPNGRGYDGYGNTDSLYHHNPRCPAPYLVGDLAIYGSTWKTDHVTVCRSPGVAGAAIFTSNGSEAGPLATRVYYRGDLLTVVRPLLTP